MTQTVTPEQLQEDSSQAQSEALLQAAFERLNDDFIDLLQELYSPNQDINKLITDLAKFVNVVDERVATDKETLHDRSNELGKLMEKAREGLNGFASHKTEVARLVALMGFETIYTTIHSIYTGDEETEPLTPITDEDLTQG